MANETIRTDKRTSSQIRPISSVLSSLNRADGSASFSFGILNNNFWNYNWNSYYKIDFEFEIQHWNYNIIYLF